MQHFVTNYLNMKRTREKADLDAEDERSDKRYRYTRESMDIKDVNGKETKMVFTYAGTLYRAKSQGWGVNFKQGTVIESKYFADAAYGGNKKAHCAAFNFQKTRSNELGKTRSKFDPSYIPLEVIQRITGFWEGDGHISLRKSKRLDIRIVFHQSSANGIPPILSDIMKYCGGIICRKGLPANSNQRQSYMLELAGKDAFDLLPLMQQFAILKRPQLDFIVSAIAVGNPVDYKPLQQQLSRMKTLDAYKSVDVNFDILTLPYVAGLWNAEGCIAMYRFRKNSYAIKLSIHQKSSPRLLEAINKFFAMKGKIYRDRELRFATQQSVAFVITNIRNYVIGSKRQQLDIGLSYCTMHKTGYHLTEQEKLQVIHWSTELKLLKKT